MRRDQFVQMLWDGIYIQYALVTAASDRQFIGVVSIADVSFRDSRGSLSVFVAPTETTFLGALEGVGLFIEHVFTTTPLQTIYLETFEHIASTFRSALEHLFTVEARFPEHEFYRGEYSDLIIASLDRDHWLEHDYRNKLLTLSNNTPELD